MSYQPHNRKVAHGNESGHAFVTVLIVIIVGALGFIAGRMVPSESLPGPLRELGPVTGQSGPTSVASAGNPSHPVSPANPLVARVNGEAITKADIEEALENMPENFQQFPEDVLKQIALDQMISERVIDAKIGSASLENDPEVQSSLAKARKQIVRSIFLEREVKKEISDERIQEAYDKYKADFPKVEEVKASHILVSGEDEARAKELVKKLDSGEDFAQLAKDYSLDGSSSSGGELGYFAKDEVVPEFAKAAFETEVGSYTKTPVKSGFGYHIIKVEDKRERPPADFETAKPYLEQELSRNLYNEIISRWREEAKVENFDESGNPVAVGQPQHAQGLEPDAGAHEDVEPATGDESSEPRVEDSSAQEEAQKPASEEPTEASPE